MAAKQRVHKLSRGSQTHSGAWYIACTKSYLKKKEEETKLDRVHGSGSKKSHEFKAYDWHWKPKGSLCWIGQAIRGLPL